MSEPIPADLLHDFGDHWFIAREPGGVIVAIQRQELPPPRYYLGDSPDEIRELLESDRDRRAAQQHDFPPPPGGPSDTGSL